MAPRFEVYLQSDLAPGEYRFVDLSTVDGTVTVTNRGYLPGEGQDFISLAEAKDRASRSSKVISDSITLLTKVLDRHEATIQKRWAKRTTRQRQDLLRRVWPDMAATHAPDLAAYRRKSKSKSKSTSKSVAQGASDIVEGLDKTYALPYMNLEDLARGNALPVLLNSRVRHPPSRFALLDEQSLGFAIWAETLKPQPVGPFKKAYLMDLWTEDLDRYGQIEDYEPSLTKTNAGRTPNLSPGLLILDLQATLLQALRDIVALILQDKPLEVYAEAGPIAPELRPLSLHPGEESPSVTDLALARPYLVPEKVDVARLSSLAHTRMAEWMDYGWAMREDPGFFSEVVGDWHQHSSTNVKLSDGKRARSTQTIQGKLNEWSHNASSAINEVYEGITVWGCFAKQLDKLASLQQKFASGEYECEHEEDVPGYREILKRILTVLEVRVVEKGAHELSFILPSSPPWRDLFVRGRETLDLKNQASEDKHEVLWLLHQLRDHESFVPPMQAAIELSRLVQTNKQQRENITALSARFIADLGLACELHSQIRMLSPKHFARRGAKFTYKPEELQKEVPDKEIQEALTPLHDLKMICSFTHSGDKYLNLGAEVDPSNGKLRYPINKSRTKENTQILQAAERHLDEIWDKYDAHLEKYLSPATVEKLQTGLPKKEELRRTPDWIEHEAKPALQTTENQEPTNVKFDGWTDEPFNKSKLEIRVKPKTTGQAGSVDDKESGQPILDNDEDLGAQLAQFTLRNRAYRTFSAVFHVPSSDAPPGEVIWTDFLHAMRAVGFTSEKLYGSVWRFTPKCGKVFGGVESAINFHEPHPSGKLTFWTARRYGRRLTRNYGITGQSFALAEKE